MNEKNVRALIHAFHDYTSCEVCPFINECNDYLENTDVCGRYMTCEEFIYKMITEQEDNSNG